jgi:hypothetical protein
VTAERDGEVERSELGVDVPALGAVDADGPAPSAQRVRLALLAGGEELARIPRWIAVAHSRPVLLRKIPDSFS